MSAATSSLSSVVNQLMRASMGASVTSTVKDEDLDRYVAELILKEAKQAEERYKGKEGIRAYLPHTGLPENNLPKANKRFLHSIIRNVDDHNTTILRAQAKAAEEVRLQREEAERADRRARAVEASQERLRRLMGGGRRRSRERAREPEPHRSAGSKRKRSTSLNRDMDDRRNPEDDDDYKHRSKRRHRSDWRDDDSEDDKSISRSSHDRRLRRHDESRHYHEASPSTPPRSSRKERNRSSSPRGGSPWLSTESQKRPALDNTATVVEDGEDSVKKSRGRSRSRSLDSQEQFLRHSGRSRRASSPDGSDDGLTPRSRSSSEDRRRSHHSSRHHSSRTERRKRDRSRLRSPDERVQPSHRRRSRRHHTPTELHEREVSRSNDQHLNDSRSRSRSLPSEERRRSHRSSRTHSSRGEKRKRDAPEDKNIDIGGVVPSVKGLSSKMDKYFDPAYDPTLDYQPVMDTNSFVQEGAFDGWNTMLQLMRLRREDKEERKRREREGGSSSASKQKGVDVEPDLTEIVYKKRGSVREWDLGKE